MRSMGLHQDPEASNTHAYIDDILVMAESKDLANYHTKALIFLLEFLGFMVHPDKTVTEPSQEMEFLGMKILSQTRTVILPHQKVKKLRMNISTPKGSSFSHNTSSVTPTWQTELRLTSGSPSTPLLQPG